MCSYTPSSILTRIEPRLYPALRGRSGYVFVFCSEEHRNKFTEQAHVEGDSAEDAESRPDLNCFYCGEPIGDISDITRRTL